MKVIQPEGGGLIKAWIDGVQLEDAAAEQLKNLAQMPFVRGHVAAMPDVHWGMGATVGSVFASSGAVIPAAVGVDIGCVDAETEILTPRGWVRIDEWKDQDILVYDSETGGSFFERPLKYIKRPAESFNLLKTKYGLNHAVSDDHRLLLFSNYGRGATGYQTRTVISGKEFVDQQIFRGNGVRKRFKTTPDFIETGSSLPYSDAELRVIVMTAADSSFNPTTACLRLKKRRKFERALLLLSEAGIVPKKIVEDQEILTVAYDPVTKTKPLNQLWGASSSQLKVIAEEIIHWDGNEKDHVFFTKKKEEADFAQFAMMAAGKRSVLRSDSAARKESDNKGDLDYRVFGTDKVYISMLGTPKTLPEKIESPDGFEYCFQVSTSFFLVRRGGVTVITGNCGMMALRTSLTAADMPDNLLGLRLELEKAIPHGRTDNGGVNDRGAWHDVPQTHLDKFFEVSSHKGSLQGRLNRIIEKHPKIGKNAARAGNHLGTLGTGNHFVEVCLDTEDRVWIMLHSGSRGIGRRIGDYFIELAKQDMRKWFVNLPDQDLAYLPEGTDHYNDYIEALHWAQEYAAMNRELMMQEAIKALRIAVPKPFTVDDEATNCHHNYAAIEQHFGKKVLLTRKGAVSLANGKLGIIPGSMGAKSFIVKAREGRAFAEAYCSCSHGAGRAMSRKEAVRRFTVEDHIAATEGVECRKDADVIDETPMAYKDIDAVMAAQADHVEIVHTLKQIVCVKG